MSLHDLHNPLRRTLDALEGRTEDQQAELLTTAALESDGYFTIFAAASPPPLPGGKYEMKALGVYACGETRAAMIQNWRGAAECELHAAARIDPGEIA